MITEGNVTPADPEKQSKNLNLTLEEQLLEAAFRGDYKTCEMLVNEKHVNVNCVGWQYYFKGWTPLYAAATGCKIEKDDYYTKIVTLLLDKQADPLQKCTINEYYWSYPIHEASRSQHSPIIKLFLDNNVPVDIENSREETPLTCAIKEIIVYPRTDHTLKVATDLVSQGAKVNYIEGKSFTPLWYASDRKKPEVMIYLLGKRADPNLGSYPSVLLHTVSEWKPSKDKTRVVKALLEAEADVSVKDPHGNTLLDIAKRMHDDEVAKLIEDKMNQKQVESKPSITYGQ